MTTTPPPEAAAEDGTQQEADRLYADGQSLFQQGRYAAAIATFEEGYAISGDANFLFNIALAHDRMDDFDGALEALARYRAVAPEAEYAEIDERAKGLRLRRATAQAEAKRTPPPPTAIVCPEPETTDAVAIPAPAAARRKERLVGPGAIVLAAVSGGATVAAVVLGATSWAETQRVRSDCSDVTGTLRCTTDSSRSLGRARQLALGADISMGIAIAAGAGFVATVVTQAVRRNRAARRADQAFRIVGGTLRF